MSIKTIVPAKVPYPFEAYSHVVSPLSDDDGGGYLFTMPDLPGLMADGDTPEAALADGRAAFDATVSSLQDMGRDVPAPSVSAADLTPADASGRFVTRVPRSMHQRLTARARAEGVSLNALVMSLLAEGLGRRDTR